MLGTAILMGGYWAYKTLGWGGYWGWDPVENASLIPWLFGTALVHGMLPPSAPASATGRANLILASLGFLRSSTAPSSRARASSPTSRSTPSSTSASPAG